MAQKVTIVLTDDIDETEAEETVTFGLDGTNYEIDLNEKNASALRDALASYVAHGRKITGTRGGRKAATGSAAKASQNGPSAREIRDWARSNGHEVPERGRIPANVREAFESAS